MQKGQYRYGLNRFTEKVVHIFAAEKHSEDYICPECREAFVPVKGDVNAKHFRHKVDSECVGGQETAIHKLAKQFICEASQINVPAGALFYSGPKAEQKFQSLTPDVSVWVDNKQVFFEVIVTHKLEEVNRQFYINGKHTCYAIDISKVPYDIEPDKLKVIVMEEVGNKYLIQVPVVNVIKDNGSSISFFDAVLSFCKENPIAAAIVFVIGLFIAGSIFSPKRQR